MTEQRDIVDVPFRPALDDPPTRAIVLDLPFPISTNRIWRNATRTLKSERYRIWEKAAQAQIQFQRPGGILGKVCVDMWFAEKDKLTRDIDNLPKCVLDTLATCKVIEGDSNRYVRELNLKWAPDITGCRVCITPVREAA